MPAPSWPLRVLQALDGSLGRLACGALGTARRPAVGGPIAPGEVRRLLVIRPGGLGDAVLALPLVRALRARFRDARLDVLMERRNVGLFPPGLAERVLLYDRRVPREIWAAIRGAYDAVVDTEQSHYLSAVVARLTAAPVRCGFATNDRARLFTHRVAYDERGYEARVFLSLYEVLAGEPAAFDEHGTWLQATPADRAWADAALAPLGVRPLLVVGPAAPLPTRQWEPARYAEVGRRLGERGWGVVLVGAHGDRRICAAVGAALAGRPVLDLCGRATIGRTAAVIARAAAWLSSDGGLLHVASALGVPTVGLFGATSAEKWAPRGPRARTVQHSLPCAPCTRFARTPPCPYGIECLRRVTVDEVTEAVAEVARP